MAPTAMTEMPNDWDRSGLPAWTYFNEELADLEKEQLFRRQWQLACHVSDLPEAGDYVCFDMFGERAVILRGKDGIVRAFHNVCRHRGSRVAVGETGSCRSALVCPFHGWSYNLDGTLRSPARPKTLPPLNAVEFGLKPIELELWLGFVFIRFKPSEQPSVGALMARHQAEVEGYRTGELMPAHGGFWSQKLAVNWKSVRDVDNEGYHVPIAHPGLQDLYGRGYYDEPFEDGSSRSFATFNEGPGRLWSVRHYKKILPEAAHLPADHRRAWLYIGVFPNAVIGLYPDSVMFYQEFPLSAGETVQRGAIYRYPEESRELRLARYLSGRIDRLTTEEDTQLIEWCCEAAQSSGYDGILLSDLEQGVRSHHDHLRRLLPVMTCHSEPQSGAVERLNDELLRQ